MAELFEELKIGSMTMPNRTVRAATAESLATKDGAPTERLTTLYRELAEGRVGAIVTGYAYVSADGKPSERSLDISSDEHASAYRALVKAVHDEGGRIVLQLVYGGSKSKLAEGDGRIIASHADEGAGDVPNVNILGPSAVKHPSTGLVPRPASAADLVRVRNAFAGAAARAKRFGFDGVELHAAHGYLLSQFLDGRFNLRSDDYGGSLRNRARLAVECIESIRRQVGDEFPVFVKMNNCDAAFKDLEGLGMTEEESLQVGQWFEQAGASCLEVSGDWHAYSIDEAEGEPLFGAFGVRLAARVGIPVVVTGGWRDPEVIDRYLGTTGIAGIGMGRPFINEPFLLDRWEGGDMRPCFCISCNFCTKRPGIPCNKRQ